MLRLMVLLWVCSCGAVAEPWQSRVTLGHLQGAQFRDSALAPGAWDELEQSIFSCCPAGLGAADVLEFGKAGSCGVI